MKDVQVGELTSQRGLRLVSVVMINPELAVKSTPGQLWVSFFQVRTAVGSAWARPRPLSAARRREANIVGEMARPCRISDYSIR